MRLRVLTYNVHKCVGGLDRRYDPRRVAEAVAAHAPDVALLQEVASPQPGHPHEHQSDLLAELLGLRHRAYFPHIRRRGGLQYGNAILSRFPIHRAEALDISVPLKKKRAALHAHLRVPLPGGGARTFHVFNLHLGLSGFERKVQLRRFLERHPFARLHRRAPIVVGGDLNDVWGTLGEKVLHPAGFRGLPQPLATFPAFAPLRALDGLYVRGDARIESADCGRSRAARAASDHLPLFADIVLH